MAVLERIRRHPVKSLGGEDLQSVILTAGGILPGDRTYGVLHANAERFLVDGTAPGWLPKSAFLRGSAEPALQAISGGWEGDRLVLRHPDLPRLRIDPEDPADAEKLLAWVAPLWNDAERPAPLTLIRGAAPFTDQRTPVISLLSGDSLRAFEAHADRPLGQLRWRGNLWIEGWDALAEADLIGSEIQIGDTRLRVTERIGRCSAVNADAETGKADGDVLAELLSWCGSTDFGIFAEVIEGGEISTGCEVIT